MFGCSWHHQTKNGGTRYERKIDGSVCGGGIDERGECELGSGAPRAGVAEFRRSTSGSAGDATSEGVCRRMGLHRNVRKIPSVSEWWEKYRGLYQQARPRRKFAGEHVSLARAGR